METQTVASLLEAMEEMAQAEAVIGECYGLCARAFPEQASFWRAIADEEQEHAQKIRRMMDIIRERSGSCAPGRSFHPDAARRLRAYVGERRQLLHSGALSPLQLVFTLRDIELSLIERRFVDVVEIADPEFEELARAIEEETTSHYQQITQQLAQSGWLAS